MKDGWFPLKYYKSDFGLRSDTSTTGWKQFLCFPRPLWNNAHWNKFSTPIVWVYSCHIMVPCSHATEGDPCDGCSLTLIGERCQSFAPGELAQGLTSEPRVQDYRGLSALTWLQLLCKYLMSPFFLGRLLLPPPIGSVQRKFEIHILWQ